MDGGGSFTESHFWHKQEQRKGLQSFSALSGIPDWTEWGFKKSGLFNACSAAGAETENGGLIP